jgi:hypothetical protein
MLTMYIYFQVNFEAIDKNKGILIDASKEVGK